MNKTILLLAILSFPLLGAWLQNSTNENDQNRPKGNEIAINWNLITNNYSGKKLFKSDFTITNGSTKTLYNTNWELYFTHATCRKIVEDSIPETIKIERLAGDFYKISPTESFPVLEPNQDFTFSIISRDFVTKYSEAPSGFYFIFFDKNHVASRPEEVTNYTIEKFTKKEQVTKELKTNALMTSQKRFIQNQSLHPVSKEKLSPVIPTPFNTIYSSGTCYLTSQYTIYYKKGLASEANYLREALKNIFQTTVQLKEGEIAVGNSILLTTKKLSFTNSPEGYKLNINPNGIVIEANSCIGVFYGIQSLRGIIPAEVLSIAPSTIPLQCLSIEDTPQYPYRGMLLDVARNFTPKENVLKLIDLISFYKINKLHLHLTDDEGWRIEIKELPELTKISSNRGHTIDEEERLYPSYGSGAHGSISLSNGYYTREDFIDILKYARERHIEIIPEIDLPGHARAAINAMKIRYANKLKNGDAHASKYLLNDLNDKSVYLSVQQYSDNVICPCEEGIYNFIKAVITDMKAMYKEANTMLTTLHIGSDEVPEGVWTKSPSCQKLMASKNMQSVEDIKSYFLERCLAIFKEEELVTSFFEDPLLIKSEKHTISVKENYTNYKIRAYAWNNVWEEGSEDVAYKIANKGYPMVLMHVTNLYLDHAYTTEPDEPGFYWGAGYVDTRKIYEYSPLNIFNCAYINKDGDSLHTHQFAHRERLTQQGEKNILGIQGALFAETLKYKGMMEYYAFPKVIALAERAWAPNPAWTKVEDKNKRLLLLEKEWNLFANKLGQHELPRLDHLQGGVNYQLPAPGMIVENGFIKINSAFPGMIIRYTVDGSDPTITSDIYFKPLTANQSIRAALFSPNGKRGKVASLSKF